MTSLTTAIHPAALDRLRSEVDGPVLLPGDAGYAEETATWNLAQPQRPAVAVGATCVRDVQAAVDFARTSNLPVAVVATGHGAVASADGAVLINVRRMDQIRIDAQARTATVAPGVEVQALLDTAAQSGLAAIVGSSPNVGVVGFTLGGGLSPVLARTLGYAADHVRALEVVTPDGVLRTVDVEHEPDLFWALRGTKGNFGVVTSLTVDLFEITRLYGGGLYYAGEHVQAVLDAYRRLAAEAPPELTVSLAFLRLPPLPFVPEPLRGRFAVHVRVAYLGDAAQGERLVAGLRDAAPRLIDTVAEMSYADNAGIHADPVDPLPIYELSAELSDFPAEAAAALLDAAGPQVDTPAVLIEVRQLGGALACDPEVPNAVGQRGAPYQIFACAVGEPGTASIFRPALEGIVGSLAPWHTGRKQINYLFEYDTAPGGVNTAYDPPTLRRLEQIKTEVDPRNLFRFNHNIVPRFEADYTE